MKQVFFIAVLMGIITMAHSQENKVTEEADLIKINHQFIKNFLNNDTIEHSKIIHPTRFLFIGKDGKFANRNDYMNAWAHGYDKTTMPEFGLVEEQVRIFGNMALIVAKTRDKTMKEGKWITGETRYTDTYVKENGKWLCVQVQLTRMPAVTN
jgi:hypothetical protein